MAAVVDERGRWLTAQNPAWQFAVDPDADPQKVWSTGTAAQRLAALRKVRHADPAGARAMVQSTWKEDGADERAAFVAALADGLSAADEPMLEAALDDRSKQVRAAAVDLLGRLLASAFVARMTARADAMLALKGKSVDVTLAGKYDPAWARDGVTEKPTARLGLKAWWLRQIVAAVPPAHWSTAWKLDPAACVKAAAGSDHAAVLTEAWAEAAGRAGDADWAAALLRASFGPNLALVRDELFPVLPADRRPAFFAEALAAADLALPGMEKSAPTDVAVPAVAELLSGGDLRLDRPAAEKLLAWLVRAAAGAKRSYQYAYGMQALLGEAALRVPPEMYDAFAARLEGPAWDATESAREQFLQTLSLRRDVQREFAV